MNRIDESARLFSEGYACSQAVLIAFAPIAGFNRTEAHQPRRAVVPLCADRNH